MRCSGSFADCLAPAAALPQDLLSGSFRLQPEVARSRSGLGALVAAVRRQRQAGRRRAVVVFHAGAPPVLARNAGVGG